MKKRNILKVSLLALVGLFTVSCGGTGQQGVTDTTIYIGNAAATTGAYAGIGVPFNQGLEAALKTYNDAGGFGEKGLKVEFKHYDDEYNATKGITYTEKLVEEDKVFALVGHFGTPTVGATLEYIAEKGIPMVYASTGHQDLYNETAEGGERAIMPVQPIYNAEGRVLLARALATTENNLGLGGTKIGVIYTNDDAGKNLYAGVQRQKEILNLADDKIVAVEADAAGNEFSAQVTLVKNANCDVVIVCANQAPFVKIMSSFVSTNYDNVKVITSYVSANASYAVNLNEAGVLTETRKVYATAWLDIVSTTNFYKPAEDDKVGRPIYDYCLSLVEAVPDLKAIYETYGVPGFTNDYWQYAASAYNYGIANNMTGANAFALASNSFAMAGYIAGSTFLTGLDRVEAANLELTWANFIDQMESAPIDIAMGGQVDYANGSRVGISDLSLNELSPVADTLTGAQGSLVSVSGITSLDDVVAGIPTAA